VLAGLERGAAAVGFDINPKFANAALRLAQRWRWCAEVHVPSRLMESISLTGARSRCVSQESRAQRMALLNRQIHSQATRAL
jgi:hypothetical protein